MIKIYKNKYKGLGLIEISGIKVKINKWIYYLLSIK